MHVTCARVSSGMVSEGHRKEHTSHPLAPSWLTIRSLHSKLVARVVRGSWRLSSSFTSLLAKESKGTILSGVTMPRRNALSQIGCLLRCGASATKFHATTAGGGRRSGEASCIKRHGDLVRAAPMPTLHFWFVFTVSASAMVPRQLTVSTIQQCGRKTRRKSSGGPLV